MTQPQDPDRDWTHPDSTAPAEPAPPPTGVWRMDAEGEESVRYSTLIEAQRELPLSPEARIISYTTAGPVLLAESTRDYERRGWTFTAAGAQRLVLDASGVAA